MPYTLSQLIFRHEARLDEHRFEELSGSDDETTISTNKNTAVRSSDSDSRESQQLVLYTNTRTTHNDASGSVSDDCGTTTEPSRRRKRDFFTTFRSTSRAEARSSANPSKSNSGTHRSFTHVSDKFHPRRTTASTSATTSPSNHRSFSTYISDPHLKSKARRTATANTCQSSAADRSSRFPLGRSVLTSAKSHWRDRHRTDTAKTSDKSGSSPSMGTSRSYKPHFPWRGTSRNAFSTAGQTGALLLESAQTPESKCSTTNVPRPRVVTSQSTGCPQWLRTAGSAVTSTAYSCASMVGTGALWGTGFALTAAQKTAGVVFDSSVVLACHGLGAMASGYSWARDRWAGGAESEAEETDEAITGATGHGPRGPEQMIGAFEPIPPVDVGEKLSVV